MAADPQTIAKGNTAGPGEAPRQVVKRDDGTDVELVTFPPGDPANPRNWPGWRKWSIVIVILLVDLTVSWAASGYSPASKEFSKDLDVSTEVATLGLSLYVLGLACGPMVTAPLSEYFGRSPIYIVSYGIFLLFLMATALVRTLGGFLILRLISGLFSSVTIGRLSLLRFSQLGWFTLTFGLHSQFWRYDRRCLRTSCYWYTHERIPLGSNVW